MLPVPAAHPPTAVPPPRAVHRAHDVLLLSSHRPSTDHLREAEVIYDTTDGVIDDFIKPHRSSTKRTRRASSAEPYVETGRGDSTLGPRTIRLDDYSIQQVADRLIEPVTERVVASVKESVAGRVTQSLRGFIQELFAGISCRRSRSPPAEPVPLRCSTRTSRPVVEAFGHGGESSAQDGRHVADGSGARGDGDVGGERTNSDELVIERTSHGPRVRRSGRHQRTPYMAGDKRSKIQK